MGMGPQGNAEYVAVNANFVFPYPETMDPVQAGGMPIVFLTAYHLLKTRGQMKSGDTVLIQAGASLRAMMAARDREFSPLDALAAGCPAYTHLRAPSLRRAISVFPMKINDSLHFPSFAGGCYGLRRPIGLRPCARHRRLESRGGGCELGGKGDADAAFDRRALSAR